MATHTVKKEEILFVSFFFGGNLLCQEAKIITSKFSIMSSSMAYLDVSKKTISLIRIRREIPGGSIIMSLPVHCPSFKLKRHQMANLEVSTNAISLTRIKRETPGFPVIMSTTSGAQSGFVQGL